MFDDIKDGIARLSVARLQKRIDALKAHQEMLNKFTEQRNLNELEHYRLQLSIGVANIVFFGVLVLLGTSMAVMTKMVHNTQFELILSALILLMLFITIGGLWESHCYKTIKYWQAASPINRAELQRRIDDLGRALTQSMAKRFGWSTKT
jgi:hypothetical protein